MIFILEMITVLKIIFIPNLENHLEPSIKLLNFISKNSLNKLVILLSISLPKLLISLSNLIPKFLNLLFLCAMVLLSLFIS